jgi:NTE family protein
MATSSKPVIGLALGSGMSRGWAHIGVLRALKAAGIEPDIIAGTSMGAVVGASYLAERMDEVEAWARDLNTFNAIRYIDPSFSGGGLIGGDRLGSLLRSTLRGIPFEGLKKPFVCVATDLMTGHEVWIRKGRLVHALRASFSLPGLFKPVKYNDRWLVDGALVNPVPVTACHALGAQVVIAVNVNADILGKKQNQAAEAGADGLIKALEENAQAGNKGAMSMLHKVFGAEPQQPTAFNVMSMSLDILLDRIARSRLAGDPPDITIRPRVGHIGLMDFEKADEIIEAGRLATDYVLNRLRETIHIFEGTLPPNGIDDEQDDKE